MSFNPEMRRHYVMPDGTLSKEGILMFLALKEIIDGQVAEADLNNLIDQRLQAQGLIP